MMTGFNLPEGWTQDRIDEQLEWMHEQEMFCCEQGCGWVEKKCKHGTYKELNQAVLDRCNMNPREEK